MLLSAVTGKFLPRPTGNGKGQPFTLHSDSQQMTPKLPAVIVAARPQLPFELSKVATALPRTH
jgi:hypothetical protein